jgi:hypothetical protein
VMHGLPIMSLLCFFKSRIVHELNMNESYSCDYFYECKTQ